MVGDVCAGLPCQPPSPPSVPTQTHISSPTPQDSDLPSRMCLPQAAQIIGSLSQLLTDPNVMVPYLKELVPQLKVALVDPIPEVRATSSKAVGALVKGMGESRFHSLIPWLMESLKTEGAGVERAGAAQALCEVIGALGVGRLETLLPDILANCMHPKVCAVHKGPRV